MHRTNELLNKDWTKHQMSLLVRKHASNASASSSALGSESAATLHWKIQRLQAYINLHRFATPLRRPSELGT